MTEFKYKQGATVTMTTEEFQVIREALSHGIEATVIRTYPEKVVYVNVETGKQVKSPTTKQLESGKVVKQLNVDATFQNPVISYNEKITPALVNANAIVAQMVNKHIQEGELVEPVEAGN